MKTIIIYSSKTGNTKNVAEAIYAGLNSKYDLELVDMNEIKDIAELNKYDNILFGFWVDRGSANQAAKKMINKIRNKRVGLFCTMGANPDSKHGNDVYKNITAKLLHPSNTLIGVGIYNGLVDMGLLNKLKEKPPLFLPKNILNKMIEAGQNSREPNDADFKNAVETFDAALGKQK